MAPEVGTEAPDFTVKDPGLRLLAAVGLLAARRGRQGVRLFDAERGRALRGTFLVDMFGIVRFAEVSPAGAPRDQNGWRKAVAALAA
jgi:alkyl hydroperoxide reductase subunit AhpC